MNWDKKDMDFLIENYPNKGLGWCAKELNRTTSSIRYKAHQLKLKQNKNSDFFIDWQKRAAKSKIGKKKPIHSRIMKEKYENGELNHLKEWVKDNKYFLSENAKKRIKEKGHPRGALGLKHSIESKEKISEKSKIFWKNMPEEMRDEFSKRASINGSKSKFNRGKATWKAGWREIGGKRNYYRSRWEANYARYLNWLKENKQILDWKHEPTTFWFEGIKRGTMSYLPDFLVVNLNNSEEYHEVKGWMDDRSKTKIKRMAIYHPNIKLKVIDSKSYKSIAKTAQNLLKDWE